MAALEKHYSIEEIAKLWHLSPKTVRELFREEPGVLKIQRPEQRSKRVYTTWRLPQSVMDTVYRRLSH
jgi:AraC-like DNA-binding protein